MELKMNYNSFIKIKDFFKLLDINGEINDYQVDNHIIDGSITIKGKFLKKDNQTTDYFSEIIPFSITMNQEFVDVEDILCLDLEHISIEGRGIDLSFDILVRYLVDLTNNRENEEILEENNCEIIEKEEILEENNCENIEKEKINLEELKTIETQRIDQLLQNTLNFKEDNLPTEEVIIRGLKDTSSKIRICFYKNDKDLEEICLNNNLSLDNLSKENQKFEFDKYHRVIINDR